MAIGEEAIIKLPGSTCKKAADELTGFKPHDLALAIAAIILAGEGNLVAIDRDKPRIGNCGAVGVAVKISEDLGRTAEGRLGVDDPFGVPQGSDLLCEGEWLGERREAAEEAQAAIKECRFKCRKEQAPEHRGVRSRRRDA